jgi:hypothetical protein
MRLLLASVMSLVIYVGVFASVLDRPLSLGLLDAEITQKTARMSTLPSPKIVILAGSNGPYSHSCVVIGAMLDLPCENAGVAVGIGLDDIFTRDAPFLHRGDIVYMPMELQQYTATRSQYRASPDGGFLLRHDRIVLWKLPPDRILGAIFCCNLADLLESLAEMPIARSQAVDPKRLLTREFNVVGDRIDTDLDRADPVLLLHQPRAVPSAHEITEGYGTALISDFVSQETAKQVVVVGGLPTDFQTKAMSLQSLLVIKSVYEDAGGRFIALPNWSRYPPEDFFNSEDHLAKPCQYLHSIAIAERLANLLERAARPPTEQVQALAKTCPSP